jgi:hypothetical protein
LDSIGRRKQVGYRIDPESGERGIELDAKELEYYDKKDIIKPAFTNQKINDQYQKYGAISNDAFLKEIILKDAIVI